MTYTEASKRATYKYRKNNPEKTKEHSKVDLATYYAKNQEKILAKKKQYYLKKKNEKLVFAMLETNVQIEILLGKVIENPENEII